jgi:hypothetical protein
MRATTPSITRSRTVPTVQTNAAIVDACAQRLNALKKHVALKTEIPIDGTAYELADVIDVFQSNLDAHAEVTAARAQLKAALAKRKAIEETRRSIDDGLKAWVAGRFGANSQQAHEFGYPPRKAAKKDAETKWHAVEQSRATREARHTMGKNQRERIKGTVVERVPVASQNLTPPLPASAPPRPTFADAGTEAH